MSNSIAVINAGSSSVKFAMYQATKTSAAFSGARSKESASRRALRSQTTRAASSRTELSRARLRPRRRHTRDHRERARVAQRRVGYRLRSSRGPRRSQLRRPVRVTETVLDDLAKLMPLAPLHQPHNLAPIRAIMKAAPQIPQIACFDTAFHRSQSNLRRRSPCRGGSPRRAFAATGFTASPTSISRRA